MAGGKETPRQKMIGMMYLVLTALLALNVSKSILDAFVAIEENTQKSNIVHVDRGNSFKREIISEIAANSGSENTVKRKKLEYVLSRMELIDKETIKMIQEIDALKLNILKESGEEVSYYKNKDDLTILWEKQNGVQPIRMNLMAVNAKDQYDVPMHEIIGNDLKNPTAKGKELWENYTNYRSKIVELTGSYAWGEKGKFSIIPQKINEYKDNADLQKKVTAMIDKSNINAKDDRQILTDLYMLLTKKEKNKVHDQEGIHWIGMTFDHSPLVAAIASLSSLQQDVLSARAMALNHWKEKVSTGEYSFNSIVGLAYGPSFANKGEEVDVKIMMAAFDSDNNPTVEYNGNSIIGKDGQAVVKVIANDSEVNMSGTVTIKNKSGSTKTEKWNHKVKVVTPAGAISLPGLNVLYRGYDNEVSAVASGFDQTILTASNATLTKSGQNWIAHPGAGKSATMTVAGKNTVTGKTQTLLTQQFRVMSLPTPDVYVGGSAPGEKIGPTANKLFPKYGPGIPLEASFTVVSWTCSIVGASIPPIKGNGADISAASSILRQAKPGMKVLFEYKLKGKDNVIRNASGVYSL